MKTNIKEKIAELKAEEKLQNEVFKRLSFVPEDLVNCHLFDFKKLKIEKRFWVTLVDTFRNQAKIPFGEMAGMIAKIIKAFPPDRNGMVLTAGKEEPTASPFILKWDNSIRSHKVSIEWQSKNFDCQINLPIEFYSDDVKGIFMRKVYDTEYHYFPGCSSSEINKMQIRSYKLELFESLRYYGGSVTTYIKDAEDKEQFEFVVLHGHTPEFGDFWQEQLTAKDQKNGNNN